MSQLSCNEGLRFINLDDKLNRWSLDKVLEIAAAVKIYAEKHGLKDVELHEVEDLTYEDQRNQRYNIAIRYVNENNSLIQQHLLMLKGTVYNCDEVHAHCGEFWPDRFS